MWIRLVLLVASACAASLVAKSVLKRNGGGKKGRSSGGGRDGGGRDGGRDGAKKNIKVRRKRTQESDGEGGTRKGRRSSRNIDGRQSGKIARKRSVRSASVSGNDGVDTKEVGNKRDRGEASLSESEPTWVVKVVHLHHTVPQQKGEDVLELRSKDKYPSVVKYQQLEPDTADDAHTEEEGRCLTESADEIDEAIENYKAKNGRFFEPDISEDSEEYSDLRSPEAAIMDSFLGDISTADSCSIVHRQGDDEKGRQRLGQSDASINDSKNLNSVRLSKDEVFQRYGSERRLSLRAEGLEHVTMTKDGSGGEYWETEVRQGTGQQQDANGSPRAQLLEEFGYAVLMEEHGLSEEEGLQSGQQSPGGGVPPSGEDNEGVMRMLEDNAYQVLMEEGGTTSEEELESMLGAALGPADDDDIEEIPRDPPSFESHSPEIMPVQRNIGVMKMLEEDGFEVLFESDEDGRRTGEGSEMSDDPGLAHAQQKGEEVDSPERFSYAGSTSTGGRFGDDNTGHDQDR